MFSFLRRKLLVGVANAAKRGNPVARKMVAAETRAFLRSLPMQSPLVPGPYFIPDLTKPLPADQQNALTGEYEQVELPRRPVIAPRLEGRRVVSASGGLGSYGMGGYGFFGLEFDDGEWLILPLARAAEWLCLDGRMLEDVSEQPRRTPWVTQGDDSAMVARLAGARLRSARLEPQALRLVFDNDAVLEIERDPTARPVMAGTRHPRAFLDGDDLAAALFFSPSADIFA